jgi:hypothetical protein
MLGVDAFLVSVSPLVTSERSEQSEWRFGFVDASGQSYSGRIFIYYFNLRMHYHQSFIDITRPFVFTSIKIVLL